jgi:hypothetical protein
MLSSPLQTDSVYSYRWKPWISFPLIPEPSPDTDHFRQMSDVLSDDEESEVESIKWRNSPLATIDGNLTLISRIPLWKWTNSEQTAIAQISNHVSETTFPTEIASGNVTNPACLRITRKSWIALVRQYRRLRPDSRSEIIELQVERFGVWTMIQSSWFRQIHCSRYPRRSPVWPCILLPCFRQVFAFLR